MFDGDLKDGSKPSFYGKSARETLVRVAVIFGVVLAYLDPVLFSAFCTRGGA